MFAATVVGFFVLSLMVTISLAGVPAAYASGSTVGQTWCNSNGGTWVSSVKLCNIGGTVTISSGNTLSILSGTRLSVGPHGTLNNYGTIAVGGILAIAGTLNNYGTISGSGHFLNSGIINEECGSTTMSLDANSGTVNPPTECSASGVPQFPAASFGTLLLIALLLPALLIMTRKFKRPLF